MVAALAIEDGDGCFKIARFLVFGVKASNTSAMAKIRAVIGMFSHQYRQDIHRRRTSHDDTLQPGWHPLTKPSARRCPPRVYVAFHHFEFLIRESVRFHQDAITDPDLPHIMEKAPLINYVVRI